MNKLCVITLILLCGCSVKSTSTKSSSEIKTDLFKFDRFIEHMVGNGWTVHLIGSTDTTQPNHDYMIILRHTVKVFTSNGQTMDTTLEYTGRGNTIQRAKEDVLKSINDFYPKELLEIK